MRVQAIAKVASIAALVFVVAVVTPAVSQTATGDSGQAYVADSPAASDANDCGSWATPCATIQHAANVIGAGTIHVGEGNFPGHVVLANGQNLVGSGTTSTFIRPDSDSGTAVTIADSATVNIGFLRIGSSSPTFHGVLLKNLGTRTFVRSVDLQNEAGDVNQKQGFGGTGLLTSNGEGQRYNTIGFGTTHLAMDICGANDVFTDIRGSENFETLRECTGQDPNNGGHHLVLGMKFTHAGYTGDPNPARVTTAVFNDNGGWIVNNADLDESDNSLIEIDSPNNSFTNSVVAPGSVWAVHGHNNEFNGLNVLGRLSDDGSDNAYWRPVAPYQDQVTITGQHILVESRDVGDASNFAGPGVYHYTEATGPGPG